jgi:hypothetical protein
VQFPIFFQNEIRAIRVVLDRPLTAQHVDQWQGSLGHENGGEQVDACELMQNAVAKLRLYENGGRLISSVAELRAGMAENGEADLLGVLTVSAPWLLDGELAAFCQFRRTWCHNLVFDFLSLHPTLLGSGARPVKGLGTALLGALTRLVTELKVVQVWAETTETSVHFYRKIFGIPKLRDVLIIEAAEFVGCVEKMFAKNG